MNDAPIAIEPLLHDPFYVALPILIGAFATAAAATTTLLNAFNPIFEYAENPNYPLRMVFKDKSTRSDTLRSWVTYYLWGEAIVLFLISVYFMGCVAKYYNSGELLIIMREYGAIAWLGVVIDTKVNIAFLYSSILTFVCFIVTGNVIFVVAAMRHRGKAGVN